MAFTPDGAMLFTERCRGLSVRLADGTVRPLFGIPGYAVVAADLFCEGQSGMHGVAIDPDFAKGKRFVYVFMPSNLTTGPRTNRIVRLLIDAGYHTVSERTDIVTDIAFKDRRNAISGPGSHSGGRVRFGPDGYLYVTTGDNHDFALPQDPRRLGGKVLRVDRDGQPAAGNGVPDGFDPRIYTWGHRNVQGIDFRPPGQPQAGQPFVSEHGPNHSDEVTPLVAGGNGGWDPQNRPGLSCPGGYCGYAGNPRTMPMTDVERFPSAMRPSWTNDDRSEGMGPALFLSGPHWKAWDGRLAVGMMRGLRLEILTLDASGNAVAHESPALPKERMRSLVQGPDGALYMATDSGKILRVEPR
jgi:glucose/arabinose dehydrogenase